jgi:D-alanine-D-alanine ligase
MEPVDILWDSRGRPDVAFIALHGPGGEDGTIQAMLELLAIPYTGSGVAASALALNKILSKKLFIQEGIPTAPFVTFNRQKNHLASWCDKVKTTIGMPAVVKPACEGSSIGVGIVTSERDLEKAALRALEYGPDIFAESYIPGVEVTAAVLGDRPPEVLPLVEIVPQEGFYDFEHKYTAGATREIAPARIPDEAAKQARSVALNAHTLLGCRGWSRVDMRLDGEKVWALEVNTIPGLTPTSLVPMAAAAAGMSFPELVERIIQLALEHAAVSDSARGKEKGGEAESRK